MIYHAIVALVIEADSDEEAIKLAQESQDKPNTPNVDATLAALVDSDGIHMLSVIQN